MEHEHRLVAFHVLLAVAEAAGLACYPPKRFKFFSEPLHLDFSSDKIYGTQGSNFCGQVVNIAAGRIIVILPSMTRNPIGTHTIYILYSRHIA